MVVWTRQGVKAVVFRMVCVHEEASADRTGLREMVRATCEQGRDGNGKHGAMALKHRPIFLEIGPRTVETFHLGSHPEWPLAVSCCHCKSLREENRH